MDLFQFTEGIHESGIPLYVKNLPWASGWIDIRVGVRIGARFDPEGKEGLAHFFEHIPFEGIVEFSTSELVRNVDEKIFLGTLNAETTFDSTVFYGRVLLEDVSYVMHFFRQLLFFPLVHPEAFEKERKVVIREIWSMFFNRKTVEFLRLCREDIYHNHSFARMQSSGGWAENVGNITREDFLNFHQRYYTLENMFLVFVGDVNVEDVNKYAEIFSLNALHGEANSAPSPIGHWPGPRVNERVISQKEWGGREATENTQISIQRVLPIQSNSRTLSLLRGLLHVLMNRIIRHGLDASYQFGSTFRTYCDHHRWETTVLTTPELADKVLEQLKAILQSIGNGQREREFGEEKERYLKHMRIEEYAANEVAGSAVSNIILYRKIISLEEIALTCSSVTYEMVCELIKTEFSPDKLYWIIAHP